MGLGRLALAAFGREGSLRLVATGLDDTFRVRLADGGSAALRVGGALPIRCRTAMVAETAWLEALGRDTTLVVPEVLRSPAGQPVVTVPDDEGGERAATLVSWLPGRKARWRFTPRHAAALGAAAARLHEHAARRFALPEGAWLKSWDAPKLCSVEGAGGLIAVAGPDAASAVEAVAGRIEAAFADLGGRGWGVINADLGPHNATWLGDEPGLFDFNDMGWGYFAHDLARGARTLRWRDGGDALVDALEAGYRSVAPLPDGWHEHGRAFETAADLFLAGYLAGKVEERGPETLDVIRRLVDAALRSEVSPVEG